MLALVASLTLNIFLVSAMVGFWVQADDRPPSSGGRFERMLLDAPPDVRAVIKSEFDAQRSALDTAREERRKARLDILKASRASPFDAETLRAAQNKARSASEDRRALMQETFLSIAGKLSDDQRIAMADRLNRKMRERWAQKDAKR